MSDDAGRTIFAGRELLDHQIVDADGRMAGKVDDLELERPTESDSLPVVTAILTGPGALAGQFGRRFGPWLASVRERLHPEASPAPARIPFGVVKRVEEHVEVSLARDELENNRGEEWAREVVVRKIPGSGHAAD